MVISHQMQQFFDWANLHFVRIVLRIVIFYKDNLSEQWYAHMHAILSMILSARCGMPGAYSTDIIYHILQVMLGKPDQTGIIS